MGELNDVILRNLQFHCSAFILLQVHQIIDNAQQALGIA